MLFSKLRSYLFIFFYTDRAGTGQTATHAYSRQYAPTTLNYAGYSVNQEYMVNTGVPVQEVRCSQV